MKRDAQGEERGFRPLAFVCRQPFCGERAAACNPFKQRGRTRGKKSAFRRDSRPGRLQPVGQVLRKRAALEAERLHVVAEATQTIDDGIASKLTC